MIKRIKTFLLFSRLHTVIGTIVSVSALYTIAKCVTENNDFHIQTLIWTLIACLGANIYIVGLNQLTDIEIDKLNKPYLPLASGAYTVPQARWIVSISLLTSIIIGVYYGGFLLATILISVLLGSIYSLPPIRLKRYYFWAAFCIIAIRGLVVNFGLFLHFNSVAQHNFEIPRILWLLAGTIFIYSLVIAWFKDIPDMEGDQNHKISTLSITLGAKNVFLLGNLSLIMLYAALITLSIQFPNFLNSKILGISHGVIIFVLLFVASRITPSIKSSMSPYYQFIWLLFFTEYIIFAFSVCKV